MTTTVLVSGATGFIAQHTIKLLLSKGYAVVGTVRTAAKGDHLIKLFANELFSYEIVPSLDAEGAFDDVLNKHSEITVFLHMASPVTFSADDIEAELLRPAVNGTVSALKAIQKYGPQIKHVVITSSYCAMVHPAQWQDPDLVVSEDSWSSISWEESKENALFGYFGSKKFAEKAAWSFYEQEKPKYTLNMVNPVFVFGPQAFDSEIKDQLNHSVEVVNKLLSLEKGSEIPSDKGSFVDVRDVAKAHLAAFENGWTGKRLLMNSEDFSSPSLLAIFRESFDYLKESLPTAAVEPIEIAKVDNKKTRQDLGFSFLDLKTSIVDCVGQILNAKRK